MLQLPKAALVRPDGSASFDGVDFGRGVTLEKPPQTADGKNDMMGIFQAESDVLVFYVPGQDYFAARWRRGYSPAHYMVFTYTTTEPAKDTRGEFTRYTGLRQLASIPLRRGAVAKS